MTEYFLSLISRKIYKSTKNGFKCIPLVVYYTNNYAINNFTLYYYYNYYYY